MNSLGGQGSSFVKCFRKGASQRTLPWEYRHVLGERGLDVYDVHTMSPPVVWRFADARTSDISFQYILGIGNDGKPLKGRVRAIADGVLILKTNKTNDPDSMLIWSKQQSVLAFEAKRVNVDRESVSEDGMARPKDEGASGNRGLRPGRPRFMPKCLEWYVIKNIYNTSKIRRYAFVVHFDGFMASIYWAISRTSTLKACVTSPSHG